MQLLDRSHPFYRPAWRRYVLAVAPSAWGLFELLLGNTMWALFFCTAGGYLAWNLLVKWKG